MKSLLPAFVAFTCAFGMLMDNLVGLIYCLAVAGVLFAAGMGSGLWR